MTVAVIAALARNRVIGQAGGLPWRIREDLQRFKHLTMGHALVMGRKTHESIGRPLPGRRNLVLTRDSSYQTPAGVVRVSDLAAALEQCQRAGETMTFIIGGGEIYRQALPLADRLYLTRVHRDVVGDTWFPDYDPSEWTETEREDHDGYSFVNYLRVKY